MVFYTLHFFARDFGPCLWHLLKYHHGIPGVGRLQKSHPWKKLQRNMGVSKNNGTPKSSILIGCSIINHPFWGTTIYGNTHIILENTQDLNTSWSNVHFPSSNYPSNTAEKKNNVPLAPLPVEGRAPGSFVNQQDSRVNRSSRVIGGYPLRKHFPYEGMVHPRTYGQLS